MSNHAGTSDTRPFAIVVGVDLQDQDSSGYAFDQTMRISSRILGSETHVVYVIADDAKTEDVQKLGELLELYLSEKAAALGIRGPQRAGIHLRRGDPAHGIAQLASDVAADLIVVGSKEHHLSKLWAGSTAERVMASTACPVFVAGPKPRPQASSVITIEPPCVDCTQQRLATQGKIWWCDRHSQQHHLRRHHVYSYQSDFPFADHDSAVIPTGTD